VSNFKPRVSIPEHGLSTGRVSLSMHKKTHFRTQGVRYGSFKARVYFPNLVFRSRSYFSSDKDPSGPFFGSILTYMHVILERLSGLALLFHNVSLISIRLF